MRNPSEKKWKRLVIFIPILIAAVAVLMLVRARKGPQQHPDAEKPRAVRVIQVQAADVIPKVTGYGYAEPGQVWQAVPQVSGRIMEVHPSFKKGGFIRQGEMVVKTDPAEYELNLSQMEASVENIRAQIAELAVKEKNIRVSLEIEKKSLALKEKNIERSQTALAARSISQTQLDQARLEYQSQSARVQEMENSLNLIPATRKTLQTGLALNQAKLDQAKLDLKHTAIMAPFDCRITETKAEIGQFVQKGQSIASADGTAWAEIAAQLPMEKMARLIRSVSGKTLEPGMENMDAIRAMFGLKVKVRVQSGSLQAQWDADFGRADATIDARTRSIGIIVVVDSYGQASAAGAQYVLRSGNHGKAHLRKNCNSGFCAA